jgi:hypothetical protein
MTIVAAGMIVVTALVFAGLSRLYPSYALPSIERQFLRENFFRNYDQAMEWQTYPLVPCSSENEIESLISTIDWKFETSFSDVQFTSARQAIHDFIAFSQSANYAGYLETAHDRAETVNTTLLKRISSEFVQSGRKSGAELSGMSADTIWIEWHKSLVRKPPWLSWSPRGFSACIYSTNDPNDLNARDPAFLRRDGNDADLDIPSQFANRPSLTDRLNQATKTKVMDVVFFARPNFHIKVVVPYRVRFYWDDGRNLWHPSSCLVQPAEFEDRLLF